MGYTSLHIDHSEASCGLVVRLVWYICYLKNLANGLWYLLRFFSTYLLSTFCCLGAMLSAGNAWMKQAQSLLSGCLTV